MSAERIKQILDDEDFTALVTRLRDRLTKKVMAKSTNNADRHDALSQFHTLDTLIAQMRSEAQNVKESK